MATALAATVGLLTEMSSFSILDLGFLLMDRMRTIAPSMLIGFRNSCGKRGPGRGRWRWGPERLARSMASISLHQMTISVSHPDISVSTWLLACLSVCPIIHLPVHLTVHPPTHPSIHPRPSHCPSIHLSNEHLLGACHVPAAGLSADRGTGRNEKVTALGC